MPTSPRRGRLFAPASMLILCILPALLLFPGVRVEPGKTPQEQTWFYLRERRAISNQERPVEVLVVGDVMLGRGVARVRRPLRNVASQIAAADLAVGNFEGAIGPVDAALPGPQAEGPVSPMRLLVPAEKAAELQTAGFDLLSLANNHSLDGGKEGLARSAATLERAGIQVAGAGPSRAAAYRPVYEDVRGMRIAFLAVDAVPEPAGDELPGRPDEWQVARLDWERVKAALAEARETAEGVVALVHWGDEYDLRSGPAQQEAARRLIEAGADVVVGSHPHAVQETEVLPGASGAARTGFVAFSLGNFVFDQFEAPADAGLALRLFFDRDGLRAAEPLAAAAGPSPRWLEGEAARTILEHARPAPERLAFGCTHEECHPVPAPEGRLGEIFSAGEIDLTGDGTPETVRLRDQRAAIDAQGQIAWESPPEWEVLDAALGDPNDDGRGEVVLALRKPDPNGAMKSHPFLIGYRGGIYRQVWGGSAVEYPILEVETADVDGDRTQELIVLEEREGGQRAITVWRWNSWVFSQVWSSPAGDYTHLGVTSQKSGGLAIILATRPW